MIFEVPHLVLELEKKHYKVVLEIPKIEFTYFVHFVCFNRFVKDSVQIVEEGDNLRFKGNKAMLS